ncbi:undecaprenyl diphosphate synthase family protein [Vallitalea okinawensis]|uniref:undecaprenyl diphosphate synthase family protein n=1 Tax=Vallitalea okinawensis TaxID=2078660 RepID=UPI000CFB5EB8|nr:undecaprenyl diphosphate synthase family protein [Vallitalea okinawensis]
MPRKQFSRIPRHIGIIPDGNRRWAKAHDLDKKAGYDYGISPGFQLYETMLKYGVEEATFYGFTQDNTKRPKAQTEAFVKACVDAVEILAHRDANLLVIGNTNSSVFPKELLKYANKRVHFGRGLINLNFLVNYDWHWDLKQALNNTSMYDHIASADISRIDLIIRWGGRRRLSGFLPIQSVYSDFYVIDEYWPDFKEEHFVEALKWYQTTDITLGG